MLIFFHGDIISLMCHHKNNLLLVLLRSSIIFSSPIYFPLQLFGYNNSFSCTIATTLVYLKTITVCLYRSFSDVCILLLCKFQFWHAILFSFFARIFFTFCSSLSVDNTLQNIWMMVLIFAKFLILFLLLHFLFFIQGFIMWLDV